MHSRVPTDRMYPWAHRRCITVNITQSLSGSVPVVAMGSPCRIFPAYSPSLVCCRIIATQCHKESFKWPNSYLYIQCFTTPQPQLQPVSERTYSFRSGSRIGTYSISRYNLIFPSYFWQCPYKIPLWVNGDLQDAIFVHYGSMLRSAS